MHICFAEYKISPEYREPYLAYTGNLLASGKYESLTLYEGTDQPCLFVEVWTAGSAEEAEQIKEERCDERSSWYRVSSWIDGGAAKMHVWTFRPVQP
ncbi:hypothetical protein [Paenibacillus protaetiae]|uniref:ABM domain-containing protein n=1 Tax=Paenibacillus protaetiae TaxID=2509456 RepID=A0A4P6EZJ2_9BACL|nr:hypothetical protein [Paenibacillus protaetiae]QAY68195.1 hypothetical protein ET464_19275 [Paenibacillus protaetiae]